MNPAIPINAAELIDLDQARLEAERVAAEKMAELGASLQAQAEDLSKWRDGIENRWLEDLRQFNGQYDVATLTNLKKAGKSSVFVNITRPMINSSEARLADILFPTDDRNWDISPTPVPDIPNWDENEDPIGMTPEGNPIQKRDFAKGVKDELMREARKRADAMREEMDDQLAEAKWASTCRDAIHDACLYGTAIIKGPVIRGRVRKRWGKMDDPATGQTVRVLEMTRDMRPWAERVDPWDFFPDMSARRMSEAEFVFQRHVMSRKELRDLAKQPGFFSAQINRVLMNEKDREQTATHLAEMRRISGLEEVGRYRYEVWEYHGPIDKDDLEACGAEVDHDDHLTEVNGVVWFCDGEVIYAEINPMDTGDLPYSVFNWEQDDSSIFGYGLPYLLRNSQSVINGAWRMAMDNAGRTAIPETVVNDAVIEPVDGEWVSKPGKYWRVKTPGVNVSQAFAKYETNSHLNELLGIFNQALQMAREESGIPAVAQGEVGPTPVQTATGMSMLMNQANTLLRRAVKNWDDDITKPFIHRLYDWNMQFSDKEEVKGDFEIVARGSSALLVKEVQQQNMMNLVGLAQNPNFAHMVDFTKLFKKVISSMQIDSTEFMYTDEEIQQKIDEMAQMQQAPVDPLAEARLQLDAQNAQAQQALRKQEIEIKGQLRAAELTQERELALAKLTTQENTNAAAITQRLQGDKARQGVAMMRENNKRLEMQLKRRLGSGI
jgi:hypothetical protein